MTTNPLLEAIRIPGATYRLPSRALFYKNGELDDTVSSDGELVVNPMRTTEELILNNADKLFTGDAVVEVFKRCVPQVLKPRELLSKDVDFLMMCLRVVTYGNTMNVTYTHTCEKAKDHEYVIDLSNMIRQAREIDPTTLKSKFKLELTNGQVITLRPPRFDRVIKLYQLFSVNREDQQFGDDVLADTIFQNLTDMIADVNGVAEPAMIMEWLQELPAGFVDQINTFVANCSDWGVETDTVLKCQDCGGDMRVNVPVNPISFFI